MTTFTSVRNLNRHVLEHMRVTNPVKTIYSLLKMVVSTNLGVNVMGEKLEDIFNYLQISDLIATSGQPTESQIAAIKEAGYQVLINLAPLEKFETTLPNEAALVESLGMEYVHIPVIWNKPTLEEFDRFAQVMQANSDRPVFVHCAGNFRVSAFMYLYRQIYQNIDEEPAQIDLYKLWVPDDVWQQFMKEVMDNR
ncbi:protein tyrosine phosphatase family protein [Chroococcidiopsidales cyanobacterium LEGE 13417]|nr:protein tyrosine phosphatase family protein [Chroococcidiopsidales cyanobacterium LEGE 13417]